MKKTILLSAASLLIILILLGIAGPDTADRSIRGSDIADRSNLDSHTPGCSIQDSHTASCTAQDCDSACCIITWDASVPFEDHAALIASLSDYGLCSSISYDEDVITVVDIYGEHLPSLEELTTALGAVSVEKDSPVSLLGVSDDFYSDTQYYLDNTGEYIHVDSSAVNLITSTPDIDIDAREGWSAYSGLTPLRSVTVAVIDTGVDYRHPDLAGRMWVNSGEIPDNGIDDDGNGYVDDIYGWDYYNGDNTVCHYQYDAAHDAYVASPADCDDHGTHCAGIIAAESGNGLGIAGVASCGDVKIMSLKIHGGALRTGTISDALRAIHYAENMGASVCNISWGSYTYSSALYTAISRSCMLFVCAAGNDGTCNDLDPLYPASFRLDNVISVTHLDADGKLCYNSNYGRDTVDFAVPASDIFSTVVGTFSTMSGSSMAAPEVSGMAALLYTLGNNLYASNIKELLRMGTAPLEGFDKLIASGGIPKLGAILANSDKLVEDHDAPSLSLQVRFAEDSILVNTNAEDAGTAGVNGTRYFIGRRNDSDFEHGTAGVIIDSNLLSLSKGGIYTFYTNDKAGNYSIKSVHIPEDLIPPDFTLESILSVPGTLNPDTGLTTASTAYNITLTVRDSGCGLKNIRCLPGVRELSEFKSGVGTTLHTDENGLLVFKADSEGPYTFYANDYRGNASKLCVLVCRRPAIAISLPSREVLLETGLSCSLTARLIPETSTDSIVWTSSDSSVAEINSSGTVYAAAPGTAIITAETSGGLTASCLITVSAP